MVGMQNIVWCGVVGPVIMQVWACALLCFAILYDCNQETLLGWEELVFLQVRICLKFSYIY